MDKQPLPRHLLRVEWQLLRMVGDFDRAIKSPEIVRTLESSARAREARDARRVDVKRMQAGDDD
ncbi:hypothetical protein GIY62_06240 [Burkholderia plantarii]|uniref:hypothetical protein n=1 Tax=Burkholderia plantarii TaxID=41899 RepID=UPI00272D0DCA|nr:hypothetical protein [Burkholderia plantarii]WLE60257.1 hypothetical protein GIY62_06240 [Burkholderia plantarii]